MADIDETDSAAARIPTDPDLDPLREAAAECTACPLYRNATQTVFGEG
jgi:DNA polymerase